MASFNQEDLIKMNDLSPSLRDIILRKITWDMLHLTLQNWLTDKKNRIEVLEKWRKEYADPTLLDHEKRITHIETVEIPDIWGPGGVNSDNSLFSIKSKLQSIKDDCDAIMKILQEVENGIKSVEASIPDPDSVDYGSFFPVPDIDVPQGQGKGPGKKDTSDPANQWEYGEGYITFPNGIMLQFGIIEHYTIFDEPDPDNPDVMIHKIDQWQEVLSIKDYPKPFTERAFAIVGNDKRLIGNGGAWVHFDIYGYSMSHGQPEFDPKKSFAWACLHDDGYKGGIMGSWMAIGK